MSKRYARQLHSADGLIAAVEQYGFLPFFRNEIHGFSIEELCPDIRLPIHGNRLMTEYDTERGLEQRISEYLTRVSKRYGTEWEYKEGRIVLHA